MYEEIKYPIIVKVKGYHFVAYFKDNNTYYDACGERIGKIGDIEDAMRLDIALKRLPNE